MRLCVCACVCIGLAWHCDCVSISIHVQCNFCPIKVFVLYSVVFHFSTRPHFAIYSQTTSTIKTLFSIKSWHICNNNYVKQLFYIRICQRVIFRHPGWILITEITMTLSPAMWYKANIRDYKDGEHCEYEDGVIYYEDGVDYKIWGPQGWCRLWHNGLQRWWCNRLTKMMCITVLTWWITDIVTITRLL